MHCKFNGLFCVSSLSYIKVRTLLAVKNWWASYGTSINSTNVSHPAQSGCLTISKDSDAVLNKHSRRPVHKKLLEPGGKYSGACRLAFPFLYESFLNCIEKTKLFISYQGATKEATGWCWAKNDLIVTAGHSVYDEEYGRAIGIEADISHHRADSHLRKGHEVRRGASVQFTGDGMEIY